SFRQARDKRARQGRSYACGSNGVSSESADHAAGKLLWPPVDRAGSMRQGQFQTDLSGAGWQLLALRSNRSRWLAVPAIENPYLSHALGDLVLAAAPNPVEVVAARRRRPPEAPLRARARAPRRSRQIRRPRRASLRTPRSRVR